MKFYCCFWHFGTTHNDLWVIILSTLWPSASSSTFHKSKFALNQPPFAPFGILLLTAKTSLLHSTLFRTTGQSWPSGFWPLGLKCPQNHLIPHSPPPPPFLRSRPAVVSECVANQCIVLFGSLLPQVAEHVVSLLASEVMNILLFFHSACASVICLSWWPSVLHCALQWRATVCFTLRLVDTFLPVYLCFLCE